MRPGPADEAGTQPGNRPVRRSGSRIEPGQAITRRLAAAGLAVHATRQQDQHELIILNVPGARSCLTFTGTG